MKSFDLYDGSVELVFDEAKHRYSVNGKYVPGVTTALNVISKPALLHWAKNQMAKFLLAVWKPGRSYDEVEIHEAVRDSKSADRNFTDSAAQMGTLVHEWIEQYITGNPQPMPVNKKMQKAVNAFLKFWEANDIEVIAAERAVYSREYNYAGTYDLKCKLNGLTTVLDWKTGSGIYETHVLQSGAYAQADTEETGEVIEQIAIVNCSVKSPFSVYTTTNVNRAIAAYNKAYGLGGDLDYFREDLKGDNREYY